MSHDYSGPKLYKIAKHEQTGTVFWAIIPITIYHQTLEEKITIWTHMG